MYSGFTTKRVYENHALYCFTFFSKTASNFHKLTKPLIIFRL